MTMRNSLLKLIHDTKAVSIWNRKTGPVFWYAAGVPGPFYLNTEYMIGRALAEELLKKIDAITAATKDPAVRATELTKVMLDAYEKNPQYKQVVQAMVARGAEEFPPGSYGYVSGGERRDWLFSIPYASEVGLAHIFLFKDKSIWSAHPIHAGAGVLHVSDLINNAASYFDLWHPMHAQAGMTCVGNLCVNTRGENGMKRLEEAGQKVIALNSIDVSFFKQSLDDDLIDKETFDEIAIFFRSSEEWGSKYLTCDVGVFIVGALDNKSFERLVSFFTSDPWGLRSGHEAFFEEMHAAINARREAA